jgi:hypothetical protein
MTNLYFFDAAYKPDLARVKAAGGIGMSVYLTGKYANTCAQPGELHAMGLGALANYEEGANELAIAGVSGGISIGQRAANAAIAKGFPIGKGIAFSLDVNTPPSQFPAVGQTFQGIRQGLGGKFAPLVYGEGAAIDYLVANHDVLGIEWLAAPKSWPGFNENDTHVGVVQLVGSPVGGTDEDLITNLDALAPLIWWPQGSPYEKGTEMLDPKDPVVVEMMAKLDNIYARDQILAQIEVWGDKTHPNSLSSLGHDMAALQAQLTEATTAIKTGSVDPNALAQAIAAHIQLAAK